MQEQPIMIRTSPIKLDRFLKLAEITATGGQAKILLGQGMIRVNGLEERKRGRKLYPGDVVQINGYGSYRVTGGDVGQSMKGRTDGEPD